MKYDIITEPNNYPHFALPTALEIVADAAKSAASAIFKAAKKAAMKAFDAVKEFMMQAINAALSALKKLMKMVPRFRHITFGSFYVQCLFDPLSCSPLEAKIPSITVCFSKIGVMSHNQPRPISGILPCGANHDEALLPITMRHCCQSR